MASRSVFHNQDLFATDLVRYPYLFNTRIYSTPDTPSPRTENVKNVVCCVGRCAEPKPGSLFLERRLSRRRTVENRVFDSNARFAIPSVLGERVYGLHI